MSSPKPAIFSYNTIRGLNMSVNQTVAAEVAPPSTVQAAIRLLRGHLGNIRADTERLEKFRGRIAYPVLREPSPVDYMEKPYPDGLLGELTALVDEAAVIATDLHEVRNQLSEVVFGEEDSEL